MRVAVLTKIPSPYQVELFNAIAESGELDLRVLYLKPADEDRRWGPQEIAHRFQYVLRNEARAIEEVEACDLAVFAWYQDGIWKLIRRRNAAGKPWTFWGERPGFNGTGPLGVAYRRLLLWPLLRDNCVPIWGIGEWAVEGYRREFGSARPYRSIPYVSNLQPFSRQSLVRREGPLRILFSGSLIKRKGAIELCRAFTGQLARRYDIRLTIMGSGPLEAELKAMTKDDVRVTFLGFRDWNGLAEVYGSADLLCAPSHYDGWGLIVPEALASGVPVIASTEMGSSRELIVEHRTGWMIPPRDEGALSSAIEGALALGRAGLSAMGDNGKEIAQLYSIEAGVTRFISAAKSALAEGTAKTTSGAPA